MTIVALRMEKAYHLANCGHFVDYLSVLGLICRLLSAAASRFATRIREAIYSPQSILWMEEELRRKVASALIMIDNKNRGIRSKDG